MDDRGFDHDEVDEVSATSNPACLAAQHVVSSNTSIFYQAAGAINQVNWQFIAATNPAQGCLAEAILQPLNQETPTPTAAHTLTAYCLFRFGVPLAANDLAHRYFPTLPVASDYERSLAQQMALKPA